jgi:hypothetical protein
VPVVRVIATCTDGWYCSTSTFPGCVSFPAKERVAAAQAASCAHSGVSRRTAAAPAPPASARAISSALARSVLVADSARASSAETPRKTKTAKAMAMTAFGERSDGRGEIRRR